MQLLAGVVCYLLAMATVNGQPSAYTVPGAFPTSLYSKYYNNPTATTAQPQPVISDPVTVSQTHPVESDQELTFLVLSTRTSPSR